MPPAFSKRPYGFTLVELLIVITILAILVIIADLIYTTQINKAYDAIRKKDLNNLKIAFEHYYSDHNCYPPALTLNNCGGAQLKPYLDIIPCDPQTGQPYTLNLDQPNGCAQKFSVYATLANTTDPQIRCNGRYVVASQNMGQSELDVTCLSQTYCVNGYYGCIAGACQLVSAANKPACGPVFCNAQCQFVCGDPAWALVPQNCAP